MSGRSHTHYKQNLHQHAQHGPHPYHVRHQTYPTYQPYPQLQQQDPNLRPRTSAEIDLGMSHHRIVFVFALPHTAAMTSFSKVSKSSSQFSLLSTYVMVFSRNLVPKLKWWYKVCRLPDNRYPKQLLSQEWEIKPHKGRQRKTWSRTIDNIFHSLCLDKVRY